jgi:hypothetical protein
MKLVGTECFSAREIRVTGSREILRPNTSRRARDSASVNLNRWVMARRATHFSMGIERLSFQLERKNVRNLNNNTQNQESAVDVTVPLVEKGE